MRTSCPLTKAGVALLAAASVTACIRRENVRPAITIDGAAVAHSVVLCTTTHADLVAKLGRPTRDGLIHRAHVVSWITNGDSPVKYLAALVDDTGVVVDLYWDIPTEIPWVPKDQCKDHHGDPT